MRPITKYDIFFGGQFLVLNDRRIITKPYKFFEDEQGQIYAYREDSCYCTRVYDLMDYFGKKQLEWYEKWSEGGKLNEWTY